MDVREATPPVGGKAARLLVWFHRAGDDLPNLVSLLVFFGVTALIFRSPQFALVVTASLGIHELGHAAALAWRGLEWRIHFGLVGAWTWSPRAERERLSHLANAIIHLGGPLFSLLLALIALGLQAAWKPADHHLLILANFSAQVGFLNLLPLGSLTDGGKIVRRMIASVEGARRAWAVILPMLVTALMLALYGLMQLPSLHGGDSTPFLLSLLLVGLWMASSLLIEARRASKPGDTPEAPMTAGQVYYLILVVWDLLVLGLIITAATPFWLAPEYVMGSLRNILAVFSLLHRIIL